MGRRQSAHLIAVTGTNGKTSVVDLTAQMLGNVVIRWALSGTLGRGSIKLLSKPEIPHLIASPCTANSATGEIKVCVLSRLRHQVMRWIRQARRAVGGSGRIHQSVA